MFKVRRGGCEEITLVQGKEQWLHFAEAAVKRYPTSKVRGSSREYQTVTGQERPRGVTPHPRSGAVAGRSYPMPPRPRPGAAAERTNPTSKELWLRLHRRA